MCTVIALHGVHPQYGLVVAANRDEQYARPASGPRVLTERPLSVGGYDPLGGGTWMGITRDGMFVAVTNQRTWNLRRDPGLRSRGELALSMLRCGSIDQVCDMLGALDPTAYNPFNLMFGTAAQLFVAYGDQDGQVDLHRLPPGLHVLANARIGSPAFPKARRAERLVRPLVDRPWDELAPALGQVLADHTLPPRDEVAEPVGHFPLSRTTARRLQSICIHTPSYGTRSATLLALPRGGGVAHYLHSAGPPCIHPFTDHTALLSRDAEPAQAGIT